MLVCATFGPGNWIPDSYDLCAQAVGGDITTYHAPVVAWLWSISRAPAGLVFCATVAATVVSIYWLLRPSMRRRWAVVATWVTVLNPLTLGIASYVLKDTLMMAALLVAMALLVFARREVGSGSPRLRVTALVGAGVALWVAVATRNTAPLPAAAVIAVLSPWPWTRPSPGVWRVVARIGGTVVAVGLVLVSQWLLLATVVHPRKVGLVQAQYGANLAALSVQADQMLLPREALAPGTDLETLRRRLDPARTDQLYRAQPPLLVYLRGPDADAVMRRRWQREVAAHPGAWLAVTARFGAAILGLDRGVFGSYGHEVTPAHAGVDCPVGQRWVPAAYDAAGSVLQGVEDRRLLHPWIALVALVLAWAAAGWRNRLVGALVAVGLTSVAPFFVLAATASYRYMWSMVLCAQLAVWLAIAVRVAAVGGDPAELSDGSSS